MSMFANLAQSIPNFEKNVVIKRQTNPELYDKLNKTFPPPAYLCIDKNDLKYYLSNQEYIKLLHDFTIQNELLNTVKILNEQIKNELSAANIQVQELFEYSKSEVPYKYFGLVGNFKFTREWRYWCIDCIYGDVPKDLARKIYNDPIGRQFIRTNGYASNIDPDQQKQVTGYHIDTHEALSRFVELVSH